MTNYPFGFSNRDDDDPDKDRDERGGDPFGAFGFNPGQGGGFDPSQLGGMLSQFGQMLSGMGSSMASGGGGAVNYDVAKKIARQQIGRTAPVTQGQSEAVAESARLAELWLDEATTLPSGASRAQAWTPGDWLDETIGTWKRLADPVAEKMSGVWAENMPADMAQMVGPMMGMLTQMGGLAFGAQLGQALGQLAKEVLTSTDVGLPLGPAGTAALLPASIAAFSEGLEQPDREVLVFLAAREVAHHRLYSGVPWLRQRLLATVEEYARGITIDFSAFEEMAKNIDPSALGDPSKLENLMSQGMFEPQTTPAQKNALERLETLLALVEGWVQVVVRDALAERLPGVAALSETMRRRRASGGPAEQTFATLVGLELRPRKMREAAKLWSRLTEDAGISARDAVWSHPDLLPDAGDLDNPSSFIARVLGDGDVSAFDDPIGALEELERTERQNREKKGSAGDSAGEGTKDAGGEDKPSE